MPKTKKEKQNLTVKNQFLKTNNFATLGALKNNAEWLHRLEEN